MRLRYFVLVVWLLEGWEIVTVAILYRVMGVKERVEIYLIGGKYSGYKLAILGSRGTTVDF